MPMLNLKCPKCVKSLNIDEAHRGKQVKCPACTQVFRVPAVESTRDGVPLNETLDASQLRSPAATAGPGPSPTKTPVVSTPADTGTLPTGNLPLTGPYTLPAPSASQTIGDVTQAGTHVVRIAGYDVLDELGRGGMGVVYRARHAKLGHEVALKMILAGGHAGAQDLARFQLEAAAVARLHHPGIIHMHEFGEHEGKPFFSLEFVEGGSLSGLLKNGPMSAREAARLLEKLARAMQHAHEAGIIHRDLKPANVLLTKEGEPKIADFGLAKDLGTDEGLSRSGSVMGTPAYMAPEQAEGRIHDIGPGADVYALGAILYECITGRVPFKGTTLQETLEMVSRQEPPSPRKLVPKLPRDLETICLRCLEKSAKKRYATAADLADDLGRFQRGEPVAARPVGPIERSWRWCRRNPAAVAVAAALLLGTAVSTVFGVKAIAESDEKEIQRAKAVEQTELAEQKTRDEAAAALKQKEAQEEEAKALRAKATALEEKAGALKKAQSHLVTAQLARVDSVYSRDPFLAQRLLRDEEALPRDMRDFTWGLYNTWSTPRSVDLIAESRYVNSVSLSPDGATVAVACIDGTVRLRDADKGDVRDRDRFVLKVRKGSADCVAFSPDGKTLASADSAGAIIFWNPQTGTELRSSMGPSGPTRSLSFTSDGKTLASASSYDYVHLWEVETGKQKARLNISDAGDFAFFAVLSPDGKMAATLGNNKSIWLWGVPGNEEIAELEKGHDGTIWCAAFSPDGKTLASGGLDGAVKLWSVADKKERLSLAGHVAPVRTLCYAPGGKTLFSGSIDGALKHWDAQTGKELADLREQTPSSIDTMSLSADGKRLAVGSGGGSVKLRDLPSGTPRTVLKAPQVEVGAVRFSPDGTLLASGGWDGGIRLWDSRTRKERASLRGHTGLVVSLAFSPDGSTLISASGDDAFRIWDVKAGKERSAVPMKSTRIVSFSQDGKSIFSGGREGGIKRWEAATGKPLPFSTAPHVQSIAGLCVHPGGKAIAWMPGEDQRFIYLSDAATGAEIKQIYNENLFSGVIAFSPDGKLLAAAGMQPNVNLLDLSGDKFDVAGIRVLEGHRERVTALCFSADGKTLASGSKVVRKADEAVGEIKSWNVKTGREQSTLLGHVGRRRYDIRSLSFNPDGMLASCGLDAVIKLWDRPWGPDNAMVLVGHKEKVWSMVVSPDSKTLASAGVDGTVKLWETLTGKLRASIGGGGDEATVSLAFRPDGKALVGVRSDGIRVWDPATAREIAKMPGSVEFGPPGISSGHASLCFSLDGKTLAVSGMNGTDREIKLFDAVAWKERGTLKGHAKTIRSLHAVPKAETTLASTSEDGTVRLWDIAGGKEIASFGDGKSIPGDLRFSEDGERMTVVDMKGGMVERDLRTGKDGPAIQAAGGEKIAAFSLLRFSSDGRLLAAVHNDKMLKLVDTRYGQVRLSFQADPNKVQTICLSPDGKLMATTGGDGAIKLWVGRFE